MTKIFEVIFSNGQITRTKALAAPNIEKATKDAERWRKNNYYSDWTLVGVQWKFDVDIHYKS